MLDPQTEEMLRQHIAAKCGAMKCWACGHAGWIVGEAHAIPIVERPSGFAAYESGAAPAIGLACENCGIIVLFSAQVLGLIGDERRPSLN